MTTLSLRFWYATRTFFLPASVSNHRSTFLGGEILHLYLPSIDQREREAIGEERPQFLHEIRARGLGRPGRSR